MSNALFRAVPKKRAKEAKEKPTGNQPQTIEKENGNLREMKGKPEDLMETQARPMLRECGGSSKGGAAGPFLLDDGKAEQANWVSGAVRLNCC